MSARSALAIHSILILADIFIVLFLITRPQTDRVNGGLGMALMALYGLVLIILLLIYEGIFLRLYYKKKFNSVKVMSWIILALNSFVAVAIAMEYLA